MSAQPSRKAFPGLTRLSRTKTEILFCANKYLRCFWTSVLIGLVENQVHSEQDPMRCRGKQSKVPPCGLGREARIVAVSQTPPVPFHQHLICGAWTFWCVPTASKLCKFLGLPPERVTQRWACLKYCATSTRSSSGYILWHRRSIASSWATPFSAIHASP